MSSFSDYQTTNIDIDEQTLSVNSVQQSETLSESSTNYSGFDSTSVGTECCICYEVIGKTNNCVTQCGHAFCLKCLVLSMSRTSACPCCRTELVEIKNTDCDEDDEDDDSEWTGDGEEDSDEDNEENGFVIEKENVEEIVNRLQSQGITMLDVVSLLINKYSKTDDKYTSDHIERLCDTVDKVQNEVIKETLELEDMSHEDIRV
jgi:hypothetical protein